MAIFQSSSHPFCPPTPPEQPRADLHQLTWRWKEKILTWKKNEKSTSRRDTTTWIPLPPEKWKSSPSHKVATRAALEPSLVRSMHLKRLEAVGFELASAPIAKRLYQAQGPVQGQVQWRSGLHWDQMLWGIWCSAHLKKRSLVRSSHTWPPGSLEHRLSWLSCWSHGHPQLSQHPHPHPSKSSSNATISRGENSNVSHLSSRKQKQHDPHMTNQSSGLCGIASVCFQTFVGSALIAQTGKPWKRLGWANLGPHRGTFQTTFQAIHAHAIQHSLVNWTSTFPGQVKKTHGEWRACNLACLPNHLLNETCQNLWTKSCSEKLPNASCVVQHPNITSTAVDRGGPCHCLAAWWARCTLFWRIFITERVSRTLLAGGTSAALP